LKVVAMSPIKISKTDLNTVGTQFLMNNLKLDCEFRCEIRGGVIHKDTTVLNIIKQTISKVNQGQQWWCM
jgi:hypothetical protein